MIYTTFTATELNALSLAARTAQAATSLTKAAATTAKAFYANELSSGLLATDIARSANTCKDALLTLHLIDLFITEVLLDAVRPKARELGTWLVAQCVLTWFFWFADSEQVAIFLLVVQEPIELLAFKPSKLALYGSTTPADMRNALILSLFRNAARIGAQVEQGAFWLWAIARKHFRAQMGWS